MSNFLKFTEMKLRTILFATVAMTIVVVGCSKQEVTTPSKEYNVEFNVAGKGGFDAATKAVKTGWEAVIRLQFSVSLELPVIILLIIQR